MSERLESKCNELIGISCPLPVEQKGGELWSLGVVRMNVDNVESLCGVGWWLDQARWSARQLPYSTQRKGGVRRLTGASDEAPHGAQHCSFCHVFNF